MAEINVENETQVFFELDDGEILNIDMNLPLQILFNDVMEFVSFMDM
ncbi:MAG: hypothetical protein R3Y28_07930 [Candidatus Gastranaerophilales bacterium]